MKLVLALAALAVTILSGCSAAVASTRTVQIVIEHSRFIPDELSVDSGETVRFVVINRDPIDHELIIGDEGVQLVHEKGTEAHHGAKPGEVTVYAGATGETTYTFGPPGRTLFGCHAPKHYGYGMKGTIEIR